MSKLVRRVAKFDDLRRYAYDLNEEPKPEYEPKSYRDGGEGFVAWCNDFVHVPIYPMDSPTAAWIPLRDLPKDLHPETRKSYASMWYSQQNVCRRALRMKNGRFLYTLVVFCWQRGEGKSLLACLVQLWKFFNFPRQQIMLGANSKDQVKFVHYDIMRDIILNSPALLAAVGKRNIQEKEIRLKDGSGQVRSLIRSISSFSGIVSNITGYTFSEIFDMKKPKFFVQLDGSIRNMPNALGVIDSTVSEKTHLLYQLYENTVQKKTTTVFFDYRSSPLGETDDYMNPHMTKKQLDDYRTKFPFGEFERYFLNLWEAGRTQIFTDDLIEATRVLAVDNVRDSSKILAVCKQRSDLLSSASAHESKNFDVDFIYSRVSNIDSRLAYVDEKVSFTESSTSTFEMLDNLSEFYDTDWCVGVGLDFGDALAIKGRARTIVSVVAKGLAGSRTDPMLAKLNESAPKYVYVLLYMKNVENHSVNDVKAVLDVLDTEFDGLDVVCSERWGVWDIGAWCEERAIQFEPIYPNYDRQKAAFKELYTTCKEARFKAPYIPIAGSKSDDVFREELRAFDHWTNSTNAMTKTYQFGSKEKFERNGVQDDSVYATGWGMYGLRLYKVDDFRKRRNAHVFGFFAPNTELVAKY